VEQEQHLALSFDATTTLWKLEGNSEEVDRTRERKEIFHLLKEHLPNGMCPREIAGTLDKNYHTTRSLLRKMEEAGDITHWKKHYIVQPEEQRRSSPLPASSSGDAIDYTDYVDDAHGNNDSAISVSPSPVTATKPCAEAASIAHERQIIRSPEQREQEDPCSSLATHKSNPGIVNNGHQRNQCHQRHQLPDGVPHSEGQTVCALTGDSTSQTAQCPVSRHEQQFCPHHPREHRVRFDPTGQAWCDQLNCWDCYRLMKIGEALHYSCLIDRGGQRLIEQGQEAWSHFVRTQRAFLVVAATEEAIMVCNRLRVEVPDLSGEVSRLETAHSTPSTPA
jgi:hypothetical protein